MTRIMGWLAAATLGGACASTPLPMPAAIPSTASAPHESAFEGYRPFKGDEAPKGWREANDEVREAGGHAGIMKAHGHK